MGTVLLRVTDDTTEMLESAEEAHRRWPAELAKREARNSKLLPPWFYEWFCRAGGGVEPRNSRIYWEKSGGHGLCCCLA